uniref:Knottin scorpion toxin-like domain-containing protein n=1 Tax=Leersia perrieri TaxID=77586 RepID=A0A0D9VMJ1_9ORYZ
MAMSRSPFRLALVAASATLLLLLFISSCHASSREHPTVERSKTVVIQDDPKCEVMVPCTVPSCTGYCYSIGLEDPGFCTFKQDFQFYCCCPVPSSK